MRQSPEFPQMIDSIGLFSGYHFGNFKPGAINGMLQPGQVGNGA